MFASHLHLIVYSLAVVLLGSLLYCIVTLVGPILFPTIIRYPWPKQAQQGARDKNITVALAGSFNPPHKGHLAMILYLAERYVALFSSLPRRAIQDDLVHANSGRWILLLMSFRLLCRSQLSESDCRCGEKSVEALPSGTRTAS
jgi:cytochrome b561